MITQQDRIRATAERLSSELYPDHVQSMQHHVATLVTKLDYPAEAVAVGWLQKISEIRSASAAKDFYRLPLPVRDGILIASSSNKCRELSKPDPAFRNWRPLAHVALYCQVVYEELGTETTVSLPPFNTQRQIDFLTQQHSMSDYFQALATELPSPSEVRNSL